MFSEIDATGRVGLAVAQQIAETNIRIINKRLTVAHDRQLRLVEVGFVCRRRYNRFVDGHRQNAQVIDDLLKAQQRHGIMANRMAEGHLRGQFIQPGNDIRRIIGCLDVVHHLQTTK